MYYIAKKNGADMPILPDQMVDLASIGYTIYKMEEVKVDDPAKEYEEYKKTYESPVQIAMGPTNGQENDTH